ncbi:MAG TPA: siroheme synthase CysG, partial [Acidimicrobiia bacterium]|nr:siroheme synthase CysG [Acidimicrobiia bacterium]
MSFRYPVTLDLDGRRCVVIGGGPGAEGKIDGLLESGAEVTVVGVTVTDGIAALAAAGRISWLRRPYAAGDLDGAMLAIAATGAPEINARIHADARRARVLLNALDDVAHCDFAAPATVRRGDLTIAVSTAGKAPALARRLRERLSQEFGPEWGRLVEVLGDARAAVGKRTTDFPTWAERWSRALDQDLIGLIRSGDEAAVVDALRRALAGEPAAGSSAESTAGPPAEPTAGPPAEPTAEPTAGSSRGSVAIVGAGPGDPDLITVRGKALVEAADVVVYDRLVHPSLWAGRTAIDAGKEPGGHRVDQDETNALLIRLAREGKRVVRLKGGDPFVFGRGAEEADALRAAGVPYEVVSAPTSAIAALAAAGIPVTDRRAASSVAFVTGHCTSGTVDWPALARSVDTLVILMGLGHLGEIVGQLIDAGRPAAMPAAAVANGTLPDQRIVVATLGDLPRAVAESGIRPPAIIVVGEVVALRPQPV